MIEEHSRGRQRGNNDDARRRRQAADENHYGQKFRFQRQTNTQCEVGRVTVDVQIVASPQNRWHRQAHDQQKEWKAPARMFQCARVGILGEGHMEHVRHRHRSRKEHQQQGSPWAILKPYLFACELGLIV